MVGLSVVGGNGNGAFVGLFVLQSSPSLSTSPQSSPSLSISVSSLLVASGAVVVAAAGSGGIDGL